MPKSNVTQYDTTAANNLDVGSISIAEGMAPSNVNNAIRELMAHTANWVSGSQAVTALTVTGEVDAGSLDVSGSIDVDGTTNLDAVDIDGAVQIDNTVTVGVDDTGYDFKLFGDTASAYLLWDTSADDLILAGAAGLVVPDSQFTLGSTAVTSTAAEINLIDGGTARGTTAVASGDGILINDAGTMRMTNVDTVSTYFSSHSVGGSNIVTTGALNSGSITSGFGAIDNGSSAITTTGTISGLIGVNGAAPAAATPIAIPNEDYLVWHDSGSSGGTAAYARGVGGVLHFGGSSYTFNGTGAATFGGNLTVTGEPTFGPGGTGTDVINVIANGGSGAAGGAVFEVRSNGAYRGGLGNKAALLGSGTSTDIELRAASGIPITFAPNNTDAVLLSTSGNMHIGGSSAPSTKLLVTGDAEFTQALNGSAQILRVKNNHVGNSSPARLIVQTRGWTDSDAIINLDAAATNARWSIGADAGLGKFIIASADKNNFDGSNEVVLIDGATGAAKFTGGVYGKNAGGNAVYGVADSAGTLYLGGGNAYTNTIVFQVGDEKGRIDGSGNLVLGNSSAEAKLDVAGDTVIRSTGADTNGRYWQYVRAVGSDPTNVDIVEATFAAYSSAVIKVRVTGRGGAALATQHYSEQTYVVSVDANTANAQAGTQTDIDQAFTLTQGGSNRQVTVDVTGSTVHGVTAYVEILSSAAVANNL